MPLAQKPLSSSRSFLQRNHDAIGVLLFLAVFFWIGLRQVMLLDAPMVYAGTPGLFSVAAALAHVKEISRKPHAIGTAEHARVRDYVLDQLQKLGLQPEVQRTFYVRQDRIVSAGAYVENIIARLPGTANEKAVLLVAHYDSTPNSMGANDDGVAVASFLEVIAVLKSGPPLKNDLIFLFSDGEEFGSIGAAAFVHDHSWVNQVGVVLNFEARGTTGTTVMFETSRPNGWLLPHASRALRPLWTNSLLDEAYKRLPNDTDLTVFENAGYAGLNFAFVEGLPFYHTSADDIGHVDPRSVEILGGYILALAKEFGASQFNQAGTRELTYFTLPGSYLVSYPQSWVWRLSWVICAALLSVMVYGLWSGALKKGGILLGAAGYLLSLLLVVAASLVVWLFIRVLHRSYQVFILGRTYNSALYEIAFAGLAMAIVAGLYIWFRGKASDLDLWCGALLGCSLLMMAVTHYVPGAAYLLAVPLLFATTALSLAVHWNAAKKRFPWVVLIVSSVPAIFLLAPVIYTFAQALPLNALPLSCCLIVLLTAFLLPHLKVLSTPSPWWLPGLSILVFLGCLAAATISSGFTASRPKTTNLFYALNGDQGNAIWGSTNLESDEWTMKFLPPATAHRGIIHDYVPEARNQFLSAEAPAADFPLPQAEIINQESDHGARVLTIGLHSRRGAPMMDIQITPLRRVFEMKLNGKPLLVSKSASGAAELLCFSPPPEGITLTLRVSLDPIEIKLTDQSYELPVALLADKEPRPGYMIPTQYPFNFYGDATFTRKSFTY